jgi:penicillin-binding protein 2B
MASMEKGAYDGNATYKSGIYKIGDDIIPDWNEGKGWGTISFDRGYTLSSNVGAASMVGKFINRDDLKAYYQKLGFGKETGFTLPNEARGSLDFKYEVEVANAAFGQGITITPVQMLQALTSIANDGIMIKPYIVDKIINPNTNKVAYQGAREEIGRVASSETITKMKSLMYDVVNGDSSITTGTSYKIEGYDIIGKTGTAQYVNPTTKKYYTGKVNVLKSFAGMFPKDDPQIIVYAVIKRPDNGSATSLSSATKNLINDVAKYLNINQDIVKNEPSDQNFVVPNFINKNINVMNNINHTAIIIGNGDEIIAQYPKANMTINNRDKIFILTNDPNITIPNMKMWSGREVKTYCDLINIKCNIEGYGYVYSQSVVPGTSIKDLKEISLQLKRTSSKVELEI